MTHVFRDKQQTSWWSAGDTQQDGGSLHLRNRRRVGPRQEQQEEMAAASNVGAAGTRKVPLRNSFSSWLLCESPRPAAPPTLPPLVLSGTAVSVPADRRRPSAVVPDRI